MLHIGAQITSTPTANQPTAQYTYAFDSWSGVPAGGTVTQDVTITANFARTVNQYTVTIESNNTEYGTVSPGSMRLPYGAIITESATQPNVLMYIIQQPQILAIATPNASTAQYTYAFDSWSGIPGSVTGDVTITANFTRDLMTYTVTFAVNNPEYGSV